MKVEYLQTFKNNEEVQKLDEEFIKTISTLFIKSYTKKVKKKIIKPISKSNLLKNTKLQNSKDKIENKVNLLLNKLSKENFDLIIKEFLKTFHTLDQDNFNKILKVLYLKIVKDDKFSKIFFNFYSLISSIYGRIFDLNIKYFMELIQIKTEFDYNNGELEDDFIFLKKINNEEYRINNLRLIIMLLENKNLKVDIVKLISKYITNTNYVPDINFWFSKDLIKKKDPVENYHEILISKISNIHDNRSLVLLKNLLEINDIKVEEESEEETEYTLDLKDDSNKSNYEIEIENIVEEFLLLEDFDEILTFLEKNKKINDCNKIFTYNLMNIYFNNNMKNYDKFKKLFVNLKKNKLIKSESMKDILVELIDKEGKEDYMNFDIKVDKIIDIFKIIQVKITKKFVESIKKSA